MPASVTWWLDYFQYFLLNNDTCGEGSDRSTNSATTTMSQILKRIENFAKLIAFENQIKSYVKVCEIGMKDR